MITKEKLNDMITKEMLSKINFQDVIENLINGNTYQDMLNIPNEIMQDFYDIALEYLEHHQFAEAADCFLFLCTLNPLASNLWIKLGNAEGSLNHFEEALEAYSMAMMCDADDPFPHFYSAYIYKEEGKTHKCMECLNVCLRLIDEHREFLLLKEVVIELQDSLLHHF